MTSKKTSYVRKDMSPRKDNMTPLRQPPPPPHHKVINFISDKRNVREPQQDGLVISLPVGNCLIKRILVDNGSAANIMMLSILTQMGLVESDMSKKSTTLVGFSGETKRTSGEITLPTYAQGVNLLEKFCIIDVDSRYNIIMGRSWIHNLKAIPFTYHQMLNSQHHGEPKK
ncbi:uncharacterized protein LOC141696158 [Apium graveolens]|uniref:uncharacterized protein LOC141696158 n=1 Tax=Apium graveolens TaxID=4045 RepID=UPI003D79185B